MKLSRFVVMAALGLVAGCATHTASVPPPADIPAETGAEKPDPNIRPLTVEQEEAVAAQ